MALPKSRPSCPHSKGLWAAAQRLQYPLMKEYTLNLIRVPILILRYIPLIKRYIPSSKSYIPLIKGYRSLWVFRSRRRLRKGTKGSVEAQGNRSSRCWVQGLGFRAFGV